jgi:hypothetical protein
VSHDVFISHSSLDKLQADAICHGLEAKGIRCWIAPRDQIAGKPYGEQITEAVETADVMVLVFSDNVNRSQAVLNEINIAAGADVTIVPFRIASVEFNPELHFYLGRMHWLDAFPQPLDTYIDTLAATVRRNLRHTPPPAAPSAASAAPPVAETVQAPPPNPDPLQPRPERVTAAPAPPRKTGNLPLLITGGVFGLVVLIAVAVAMTQKPAAPAQTGAPSGAYAANTAEPAPVGEPAVAAAPAPADASPSSIDAFNAAFDKSTYASCLPAAEAHGATSTAAASFCTCMIGQVDKLTVQQKMALGPNSPELQQADAVCEAQ